MAGPTRRHRGNRQLRVRGAGPLLDHRHPVGTAKLDRPRTPAQPAVLNAGRHANDGPSTSSGSRYAWNTTGRQRESGLPASRTPIRFPPHLRCPPAGRRM